VATVRGEHHVIADLSDCGVDAFLPCKGTHNPIVVYKVNQK
jgi:hypothetical protein